MNESCSDFKSKSNKGEEDRIQRISAFQNQRFSLPVIKENKSLHQK